MLELCLSCCVTKCLSIFDLCGNIYNGRKPVNGSVHYSLEVFSFISIDLEWNRIQLYCHCNTQECEVQQDTICEMMRNSHGKRHGAIIYRFSEVLSDAK